MTEPRLRDLYVWLEAQRAALTEQAGALAEAAEWARADDPKVRRMAADRCERIASEQAIALMALDRVHPRDVALDEDTAPIIVDDFQVALARALEDDA